MERVPVLRAVARNGKAFIAVQTDTDRATRMVQFHPAAKIERRIPLT